MKTQAVPENVKAHVRDRFGRAARNYAESAVHRGGRDLEAMLDAAPLPDAAQPGRLLDVGTGAGHTAFAFAARVARVDALDLTEQMLEEVRRGASERGLENVHCQLGDAEDLPYPDDCFDILTSRLCAHHFEDVPAFVAEAARVLKPGGCFLLMDSLAPEKAASDTFFNTFELLRDPSHVRNYSRSNWSEMLAAAGFESEVLGEPFLLHQDFDDWVARIDTPPTAVAHLRYLFETATPALRSEFEITLREDDAGVPRVTGLSVPCGLIRAVLR
jgi:ubiquinone/menaquinone biosynthesis C-methylase UbiE